VTEILVLLGLGMAIGMVVGLRLPRWLEQRQAKKFEPRVLRPYRRTRSS
jgi:predicted lysophospholipase L1 biosynthesis ABC-type transport system permease subunit